MLRRLCVFCGSRSGTHRLYEQAAQTVGQLLCRRGVELVYGGGKVGLMGTVADACLSGQAMGAGALGAHIQARLGIDFGQTSANGDFTLEPVYCLGNCACSPAIFVGDDLYGRVTSDRFDEILLLESRSGRS